MRTISVAILALVVIVTLIQYAKPSLVYKTDGSLREFGVGYRKKTVVPLWLVIIMTAILCYVGAAYFS